MAYKYSKGSQVIGDLKAADDAQLQVAITKAQAAQKVDTLPSTGDALLLTQLKKSHANWHPEDNSAQTNQAYKELSNRYSDATRQLEDVDKRINSALIAQAKASAGRGGPLKEFTRMQNQAVKAVMLGGMSENQSRVLGVVAIGFGLLAIIGRID